MCQLTANPLNQKPLSPLPIPDLSNKVKKHTSRLKFWEINSRYHCAAQLVFIPHASLSAFSKGLNEVIN